MRKAYKYLKWLFVLLFYAILYIIIYASKYECSRIN